MMMNYLIVLSALQVCVSTDAYDFSCPSQAQWNIRAKSMCMTKSNYSCLFDVNLQVNIYRDKCIRPRIVGPGYKYVFQPNPNRDSCSSPKYQPFIFNTIGYSDCVFLKSYCTDEGQKTYTNGTTRSDRSCSCKQEIGYNFVSSPQNECYCNPSSEDCSCYLGIYPNKTTIDCKGVNTYTEINLNSSNLHSDVLTKPKAFKNKNFDNFKYNLAGPTYIYRAKAVIYVSILVLLYAVGVLVYIFQRKLRQWMKTPPVITVERRKIEVLKYGTQVNLKCRINSESYLTSVKWFKGEQHINTDFFGKNSDNPTEHMLTLNEVRKCDIGKYKCEAHNAKGSSTSEPIHVVYSLPVITEVTKKIEVLKYGTQVILSCKINSESNLRSVEWFKGEHSVHSESFEMDKEIDDPTHIFTLKEITECDMGEYKCEVHNAIGSDTSEPIHVLYALPVVTVETTKIEVLRYGTLVELSCKITSESTIESVNWFRGEQLFKSESFKQNQEIKNGAYSLIFNQVQESDIGVYKCEAHNAKGSNISEPIHVAYNATARDTFMDAIQSGTEIRRYVRIQVIGKDGVGKSSLVRRLLGGGFETEQKSTDGIDIIKRCQINTDNGEWIVCQDETESKERIRRILQAVDEKHKRNEPVLDQILQSHEQSVLKERKRAGQEPHFSTENISERKRENLSKSKENQTETETRGSNSMLIDEPKFRNNIVALSNDKLYNKSTVTDIVEEMSNVDDLKKDKQRDWSPSQAKQKQKNVESPDEMTKKIIDEMDAILSEVKREQDKKTSQGLVECGLWDFAGQKDYYVTHQIFLNPHAIYLLVADISEDIKTIANDEDFDSIGEFIDFWFDSIHCLQTDCPGYGLYPPVIVVCTHLDKFNTKKEVDKRMNEYIKQFQNIIGCQKKGDHKRHISFLSNKTFLESDCNELREKISDVAKEMNYFGEELSTQWIQLENALAVLKDSGENVLSFEGIKKLSQNISTEEKELLPFLKYQHKIGNIIFFEDIRDYIIIQPKWLVKCFRCLVCDNHPKKRNINLVNSSDWKHLADTGELTDGIIDRLFAKEPTLGFEKYRKHLLNVMEKFDIIVKPRFVATINKKSKIPESYYMPCMLTKSSTSFETIQKSFSGTQSGLSTSPWLVLEFDFLPVAYFNYILFYFIRKYVCEEVNGQKAIYRGKALLCLDNTKLRKLFIGFSRNAISLQIWKWAEVASGTYLNIIDELCCKIGELDGKLDQNISKTCAIKGKCSNGNYTKPVGRLSYTELIERCEEATYLCDEHKVRHCKNDLENTWFQQVDILKCSSSMARASNQPGQQRMKDASPSFELKWSLNRHTNKRTSEEQRHVENKDVNVGETSNVVEKTYDKDEKVADVEKPLSKEQQTKITRNYTTIIDNLKIDNILDHMLLEEVFSLNEVENINSKVTQKDRNRAFIYILLKGSQNGYTEFIRCLHEEEYFSDIANKIEKTVVKQVEDGTHVEKPLSKEQHTKITRNYAHIINSLNIEWILDHMMQSEGLSLNEVEKICSKDTQKDKNRAFISILLKGSQKGYTDFIQFLHENDAYSDIANEIEKTVVKQVENRTPVCQIPRKTIVTRPMTKEHQAKILRNSNTIIDFVMIEDILDYMITSEVFSINDADQIRSQATHKRKNSKFIDILIRSNLEGYSEFIECLRTHDKDYNHIADQIDNSSVEDEEDKSLDAMALIDQKVKITKNLETIATDLEVDDLLDTMLEESIFTMDELSQIGSKSTREEKNIEFAIILIRSNPKGYTEFIKYLRESDVRKHIADQIENTVVLLK